MEEADPLYLIEFLLVAGMVLAFCAWELWSVRRSKNEPPPTEDRARHPEG